MKNIRISDKVVFVLLLVVLLLGGSAWNVEADSLSQIDFDTEKRTKALSAQQKETGSADEYLEEQLKLMEAGAVQAGSEKEDREEFEILKPPKVAPAKVRPQVKQKPATNAPQGIKVQNLEQMLKGLPK